MSEAVVALVHGVDVYPYYVDGEVVIAKTGDRITVTEAEYTRGRKIINGSAGPALISLKERAEELARTAKAAADAAADAAAHAQAEYEAALGLINAPDDPLDGGGPLSDEAIGALTVAGVRDYLAANPGEAERVRRIEENSPNPRRGVLDLLPDPPAPQ